MRVRCEGDGCRYIVVASPQTFCEHVYITSPHSPQPSTLQSKLSSYFNVPHFVWEERPIASKCVQRAVTRLKVAAREGKEEDGTTPTSCGGGGAAGSTLRLSESSSSEGE